MKRRTFLIGAGLLASGGAYAAYTTPLYRLETGLKLVGTALAGPSSPPPPEPGENGFAKPDAWAEHLIAAAESQIGVTVIYDPAYISLPFPNGDLPRERGVCTDVVVRAYRDAFGYDLQAAVNADMRSNFSAYPKIWGLKQPDRNIDHRRVPNLQAFFRRQGAALPVTEIAKDYQPGDIVSQMLPGNLPHIAIVSHRASRDGQRPMLVHNIGAGTQLEDRLFDFQITGHYRYKAA
ncbi:hypothetical protein SIAM614_18294 [Roseibium aggregatum IAM 12614]|uniref:DUF1287 domain-containing protein n=1 Tax=Roseibium aggregatum (strain ATCC 25650 / DSM 13394 / JCM 20685 / NBRC 16684 / NCIMB 2208 / IAM 12614 / B1) TaxID=384765 RepID=A0NPD9_ROSAI|nr:DUF1287 domain-containing protein [Roseibium aggregatum]EAV45302.1 hypothetical protein SIAM614_18294 [Roseibium aggregatum IAM 12614]